MKGLKYIVIIAILVVLVLVSGQVGCEGGIPGLGGGGTQATKTGIDYSLTTGVDYISSGKLLQQGETFLVGIHIENYDKQARIGQVCIRDNIADNFQGISSQGDGECQFFNIAAAQVVKKETTSLMGKQITETITPGTTDVYFPQNNEYSYIGLPSLLKPYDGLLTVSLRYRQISQATATVTVPGTEQPTISQEPAPIMVGVTKTVHKTQEGYKLDLEISLQKRQDIKIFSSDFTQENISYFNAEIVPETMSCSTTAGEPVHGVITIGNEKLIKCSSLVSLSGQASQSYPLVITLDYGVDIEKSYPFGIETQTKAG